MSAVFYINPLARDIRLDIIEKETKLLLATYTLPKTWNDFETIPEFFVKLKNKYFPTEIWCITWPGPFTLMRIITLTLNGLAFLQRIKLKSAHVFDIMHATNPDLTPIIEANSHEYMIRRSTIWWDEIIKKEELPIANYVGKLDEPLERNYTLWHESTEAICHFFETKDDELRLSPLYIKPPKITLPSWKKL